MKRSFTIAVTTPLGVSLSARSLCGLMFSKVQKKGLAPLWCNAHGGAKRMEVKTPVLTEGEEHELS